MVDEPHLLPLLTMVSGPLQGVSFRLRTGRHTIGRGDGVDIPLEDIKTSRRHAAVDMAGGLAVLTDLGSTNGTWVNGERITGPVELRDGDRLRIGHVDITYFDPGAAVTDPGFPVVHRPGPPGPDRPIPPPAALAGPTDSMPAGAAPPTGRIPAVTVPHTRRRPTRLLLVVGGCVVLVSAAAWMYQFLG